MALDTESYESYLAPRVAAVQSERRPGQGGNGPLSSAAVDGRNSASSAACSPKNGIENGSVGGPAPGALYSLYDSPTMLPRTPLAPG